MKCPYCNDEMKKGTITGDGRAKVKWVPEGDKIGAGDLFTEKGVLSAPTYSMSKFKMSSFYCERCKKMMFDTEVKK